MNITPLSTVTPSIGGELGKGTQVQTVTRPVGQPTFLDVFSQIFDEAVTTNEVKSADMIRLMLGDADDLEQIMLNAQKAEFATDLMVTIRNTALDAYNEIIKMQI